MNGASVPAYGTRRLEVNLGPWTLYPQTFVPLDVPTGTLRPESLENNWMLIDWNGLQLIDPYLGIRLTGFETRSVLHRIAGIFHDIPNDFLSLFIKRSIITKLYGGTDSVTDRVARSLVHRHIGCAWRPLPLPSHQYMLSLDGATQMHILAGVHWYIHQAARSCFRCYCPDQILS